MFFQLTSAHSLLRPALCMAMLLCGYSVCAQTADFTALPVSGCAPLVVNFSDNSTGAVTAYSWNLGNSVTSTLKNPSTTYTNPGTFAVSLTVSGPGGSNTKTVAGYITVYDKPAVSFTAATPRAGCPPYNAQFSATVTANSPGAVSYNWDFGDGASGTGASPAHIYTTAGIYTVTLTVTNSAGCSTTAVQNAYVTAYTLPAAAFLANSTSFCSVPATVTLADFTTGNGPFSTAWNFGDGSTGAGGTVSHTYTTSGSYTVTLNVTDANGCHGTLANPGYISVNGDPVQFTASSSACPGLPVSFTGTTPGISNISWNFGDGASGTGASVTHAYASAGSYTVTMTALAGTCTKTATQTVTINPKPVATITTTPAIPCPKPVTLTFTGNSSIAASYDWRWKSGGTATGQTVSKLYLPPPYKSDIDSVTLIVTSAAGCKDTVGAADSIRDLITRVSPQNRTFLAAGCIPFKVKFSAAQYYDAYTDPPSIKPYPVPAISWRWDFDDGGTSTLDTPTHTFTSVRDYHVRLIITTGNGCPDTAYTLIHADTPIHPSFTVSPQTICPGQSVRFINTTTPKPINTTYRWVTIDTTDAIPGQDTMFIRIKQPGTYDAALYASHLGCIDTARLLRYIVVNPPFAVFKDSVYCPPSTTVRFTNLSTASNSQVWDFGDGTTDTAFSPTHAFPDLGLYDVKLVAYNSTYGCTDTFTKVVEAIRPVLEFTVSDSAICKEDSVDFTTVFTGFTGGVKYAWSVDNVRRPQDTLTTFGYRFHIKGYHDVILYTLSRGICRDSIVRPARIVVSQPDVHFGAFPPTGCQLDILFRDSSTNTPGIRPAQRLWVFGDGDSASNNLSAVSHIYPASGRYSVRLIVTDSSGCSDSLTRSNYVEIRRPQAAFNAATTTACTYQVVQFTSSSTGATGLQYQWNFGDGATSTLAQPSHIYAAADTYTVRLIVIDSTGCRDTLTRVRYLTASAPDASFTQSDTLAICPPLQVNFANTSTGAAGYLWNFGTGSAPVVVANPVNTFSTPGLYHVQLIATNSSGCKDTAAGSVRVLGYNGAFSYTPLAGCSPLPVSFTTIAGIPKITWDFSDGITDTTSGSSAMHIYTTTGGYLPTIVFSDGKGCSSSSRGLDTIRVDTFRAAFTWTSPCVGEALALTDSSFARYMQANAWSWSFDDGGSAAGAAVTHIFATSGRHMVMLIAGNASGCRDTVTHEIAIHELPLVKASGHTRVCAGDPDTLSATGAVRYVWSPASGVNCLSTNCDSAEVHPADTTVYVVTGTDENGCRNSDSIRVAIHTKVISTTGPGGEICVGESFRLFATGAVSYEWTPPATIDSPRIAAPLATPTTTTAYIVIAKEGSCLSDSQRVTVVVHPLPLFSAGPDETISLGSAVTLHATRDGIERIEWRADTSLGCLRCFDPNAFPFYTRTYYATGYNEYGCSVTDSVTVHVRCNGSLVFIPNTFTPNGDGRNDYFYPRGEGIERMSVMRIYNRWGELMFEKTSVALNDERSGWDGTYQGKALPPDVYVYTMESRCATGEPLRFKGDITIIR